MTKLEESIFDFYQLDLKGGFLPYDTPLSLTEIADENELDFPEFSVWEKTVLQLPFWNTQPIEALRIVIRNFPNLTSDGETFLKTCKVNVLRRCHVVLGFLIQSFVHGGKPNTEKENILDQTKYLTHELTQDLTRDLTRDLNQDRGQDSVNEEKELVLLPRQIAVPYVLVCDRLKINRISCACTFDTWNWKLKNHTAPISLDNLDLVSRMTSETAEIGFHLIPCAMHNAASEFIVELIHLVFGSDSGDSGDSGDSSKQVINNNTKDKNMDYEKTFLKLLNKLKIVLSDLLNIFKLVFKWVDKESFTNYRRLLKGFYPIGVLFELNDGLEELNICKGPSAGQSCMFFLFDSILGIVQKNSIKNFQQEMLDYLPFAHKRLIQDFNNQSKFRFNDKFNYSKDLLLAHTNCLSIYKSFRQSHLKVALYYLDVEAKGTGETTFREMLKEGIENMR